MTLQKATEVHELSGSEGLLATHVAACDERYRRLEEKIDGHTNRLERLESLLIKGGAAIIGLLAIVVIEILVGALIAYV